jgi:hypothetical protein
MGAEMVGRRLEIYWGGDQAWRVYRGLGRIAAFHHRPPGGGHSYQIR